MCGYKGHIKGIRAEPPSARLRFSSGKGAEGVALALEEEEREAEIRHKNEDKGDDHGRRGRFADALGPARGREAPRAAHLARGGGGLGVEVFSKTFVGQLHSCHTSEIHCQLPLPNLTHTPAVGTTHSLPRR